jgi:hypothetical protein
MNRDSPLRIALNMYATPGVYALLLESGVSTAAGIAIEVCWSHAFGAPGADLRNQCVGSSALSRTTQRCTYEVRMASTLSAGEHPAR